MKLQSLAANRTILSFDDGTEIFFSYETPVAGYLIGMGYVKTDKWYSSTTTRHINKYFNDVPATDVSTVDQSVISTLIKKYIPNRY